MRFYYIILCLSFIIAITACKSSKSTSSQNTINSSITKKENTILQMRLDSVASQYKDWNDVVIPVDLGIVQPKEFSISGKATMIKDESIYISVRVLGFEAANIFINNDSIFATYKIGKIYIAEDIKNLLKGYPASVSDLQNLLLGRAFILGNGTISPLKNDLMTLKSGDEYWTVTPKCNIKNVSYSYSFENKSNQLKDLSVMIEGKSPINCIYQYPKNTNAGVFSQKVTISTTVEEKDIKAFLNWNLNNAIWNSGAKTSWKQPKGYNKVEPQALLNLF